jgi:RNA polymerase sigma-70 factor (ECF subfamily)
MALHGTYSDQEILLIARENPSKGFELAFDQYWPVLYRQAYKKTQSKDFAKDLVQDVFIALWDNMDKLVQQESLLPYLYTILRNNALKQFEKDNVRLKYAMERTVQPDDFELTSHHLLLSKELQAIITDEISQMPARMKKIYLLKKESNYSIKQIAIELDLSEQTVKNQLHMATNRLKDRIRMYDPGLISVALIVASFLPYTQP